MTPYNAAKSYAARLRKRYGAEETKEIVVWTAKQTADHGFGNAPAVCWEGGPYEWAIDASLENEADLAMWREQGVWVEPYNGFVLNFYKH